MSESLLANAAPGLKYASPHTNIAAPKAAHPAAWAAQNTARRLANEITTHTSPWRAPPEPVVSGVCTRRARGSTRRRNEERGTRNEERGTRNEEREARSEKRGARNEVLVPDARGSTAGAA